MSSDSPWSSDATLAKLSRTPFGDHLAARVAEKLEAHGGKDGLWHTHRDYCGHGLIFHEAEFRLLRVSDGNPYDGKILLSWQDPREFAEWLARQSDYSLSGADESEPALHTTVRHTLNNQRITRERLRDYLHDCHGSMVHLRAFLYAIDIEFGFLVAQHKYRKHQPRLEGRECVVNYRALPAAGLTVTAEYKQRPFITATLTGGTGSHAINRESLDSLAKKRNPEWKAPGFSTSHTSESDYREYFRAYAELIQSDFPELLPSPTHEQVEDDSTTDVRESGRLSDKGRAANRATGVLIAVAAFLAGVWGLRFLTLNELPSATGSPRANLGILLLLGSPAILLALGIIQALTGARIRQIGSEFVSRPLVQRVALGFATLVTTLIAIAIAAALAGSV